MNSDSVTIGPIQSEDVADRNSGFGVAFEIVAEN
jgi:hypothetical protein